MLLAILHATQQAATLAQQVAPNVYVTVQPPSAGMPEWVKILISAAVGAFLGIASNIAMEYIKPIIAKRSERKMVSAQLNAELLENMRHIEGAEKIVLKRAELLPKKQESVVLLAGMMLRLVETDRFDYFFANHKTAVYELDDDGNLTSFYAVVRQLPATIERKAYEDVKTLVTMGAEMARAYILHHNLNYVPKATPIEKSFEASTEES